MIAVPQRESDEVVGVQWELPGAVARRDQGRALGFLLNPARKRAFCQDVKEFMDILSTALEFAERGMGKGSRTPR